MASIDGSTATLTRPALSSYARSDSRSSSSISALTSTHAPSDWLSAASSLRSEKRVMRVPSSRTQNSPFSSCVWDTPSPNRLQLVPRASKWWASTAGLGRIRRRHRLDVPLPDARRDREAADVETLLRREHRWLQRRGGILQMRGHIQSRRQGRAQGEHGRPELQQELTHARLQSRDRSLEERDLVEGRAKDLIRIRAEVAAQDLLINGSEVDGELEVAC